VEIDTYDLASSGPGPGVPAGGRVSVGPQSVVVLRQPR
jgi:hypothetical protein